MEGTINITGQIGSYDNVKGVELIDVIKQVQGQPFAESFLVYINSEGGVIDTGFDIYNYLLSLNKPLTTIGSGIVASIATVVFMAGNTRKLRPNTEFMIHMPSGMIGGTSSEIEAYNEELKKYDKKLIDFYVKSTQLTQEAILPLLKNETWLSIDDAFDMKFITEMSVDFPMVAKAKYNFNTNDKMTQEDKGFFMDLINKILNKGQKFVNLDLTDADGVIVSFPDLADGDKPKVDDMATVDGKPAEGTYLIDGFTYTFIGGKVTEIIEAEEEETSNLEEQMQALRAENEALKEQLATAVANHDSVMSDVVNLKKKITSRFEVDSKKEVKTEEVQQQTKRKLLKD